jgi:dihydroorotase
MKLKISNGRVIDPANHIDDQLDIFIDNGLILAVGKTPEAFIPDRIIDATDQIVCPGLVDISARLGEPSQQHASSISSETQAAIKGGITSLCIPPDTDPIIDSPAAVELLGDRANKAGSANIYIIGALTQGLEGELLSEMLALKKAGCIGVSNGLNPIRNTLVLRRAMEYAATLDLTIFINAADPWLQSQGCIHEGMVSTRLGLGGIPEAAETIAIARDISLIEHSRVTAHFHNISSGKSAALIKEAQERGLPITADVSPHHLHLSEHDIGNYDSLSHVIPPLRSTRDREQLQQSVREGVINTISSHHHPLDSDAKLGPFADTTPGISGLETLLPLTLKLVDDDELSLQQAIASLTINPAKILGLDAGHLSVGAKADICIFNPESHYECLPEKFLSAGKNSPFAGWHFHNEVTFTLLNGQTLYEREPNDLLSSHTI